MARPRADARGMSSQYLGKRRLCLLAGLPCPLSIAKARKTREDSRQRQAAKGENVSPDPWKKRSLPTVRRPCPLTFSIDSCYFNTVKFFCAAINIGEGYAIPHGPKPRKENVNRTHRTFSEQEKDKLLREVENSRGSTRETLARLGISKSTYYGWKAAAEIDSGVRLPTENTPRNFYFVSQALKHQKTINKILAFAPCTAQAPLSERLAVIAVLHNARNFSVHALCDALGVKRGTDYNYAKRGKVRTGEIWCMRRKGELEKAVEQVFTESKQRFGSQKIVDALKAEGIATTRKYVLRIMRDLGLHCIRQSAKANLRTTECGAHQYRHPSVQRGQAQLRLGRRRHVLSPQGADILHLRNHGSLFKAHHRLSHQHVEQHAPDEGDNVRRLGSSPACRRTRLPFRPGDELYGTRLS